MPKNVIYLTGLPGVGKSAVVEAFRNHGVSTFYTGNVHPETSGEEKLRFGDENFEEEDGFVDYIVETALNEHEDEDLLVVDSLRSPSELAYVRERPEEAHLVAVVCEKAERRRRLAERDDDMDQIRRRERRELGVEADSDFDIGHLVAVADYYVDNSGTLDELHEQVNNLVTKVR